MKSFAEWLEERDPEVHAEVFGGLGRIARKAALIGSMATTAAGGAVDVAQAAGLQLNPHQMRMDQQNREAEAAARQQQQRKSTPITQQGISGMKKQ